MVHTKLISASIFAAVLASAGTALAASPTPVQTASQATRLAMVTNDNGAYHPASASPANQTNARLCGNTVTSAAPDTKPTFRRPSFMNWSWYATHGHGN